MNLVEHFPHLPTAVAFHTLNALRAGLPAPVPDTPEQRAARDASAIALINSLQPIDEAEAALAVKYVLDSAHAMECFRLAKQRGSDTKAILRDGDQALRFMRAAMKGRQALLDRQAQRPPPVAPSRTVGAGPERETEAGPAACCPHACPGPAGDRDAAHHALTSHRTTRGRRRRRNPMTVSRRTDASTIPPAISAMPIAW